MKIEDTQGLLCNYIGNVASERNHETIYDDNWN